MAAVMTSLVSFGDIVPTIDEDYSNARRIADVRVIALLRTAMDQSVLSAPINTELRRARRYRGRSAYATRFPVFDRLSP